MCKKGHLNLFLIFIFLLCSGMINAGINDPGIISREKGSNIISRYNINDSLNIKPAAAKRLELNNPDGGEVWQIGTTKLISWKSNGIGPITIEVTTNGGTSWSTIANGVDASDGSYAWYIDPASYSSSINTRIRITEIDPTLPSQDESAADFTLTKLSLLSPSAGEKLQVNSSYQIRWNASSDIANVKIEYTSDGNVWNTLATVPANSGSYSWFVNTVPSASARIRVSNAALSSIEAVSSTFAVCSLQLLSPNGGNSFFSGETRTITWNSTNVTNVSIEYSVNNGLTWTSVTGSTPAGTGNYLWTIPDAPSKDVMLRISDASASHISDLSDSKFSIYSLSVLAPNTRLGWIINSSRSINWVTNISGNVKIELSTDNGITWPVQLASGVVTPANQGTVSITVPDLPTDRARIKITSIDNPAYYDISDTYFTIGSLALTYPAGGEIWQAGGVYDILWTSSGLNTVRIEYSTDGLLWNTITNSAPAAPGSYSWNIPSNLNSTTLKIRISESETGTDISSTSSPVTVTNLSLISPNSSSIAWEAGTRQNITWSNNSSVTNVNIDYSTDNGNTWNSIAANYPAAGGIYQWNIPSEISSKTVRIRVSSSANSAISYIGAPFRIGNIEVTSPNGGEKLFAGRGYTISWTKSSSIDRVRIQYSVDGGLTFTTIASNITGLSYNWQVPNTLQSLDARIRITDSDFPAIDDTSNNSAVIASINIVNPNGGGGYFVGSTVPITWTSSSINQVRIDYSTNNGLTWLNIVPSMAANAGPYNWTVPPSATSQALIRITDLENPSYYDQSDNTFHISSITLNSPNGGENLQTGSQKIISWSNSTDITAVDIELSVDNGTTWLTIADSIPAAPGSFNWNIGNTPSSSALIRISDAGNPGINDQSNSVFTIKHLLLTSPNGGEFITADSLYNITWNSANIANVMLEFSTDNGSTWSLIKASTPAAARVYSWRVPFSSTTRALVRISDADNLSDNIRDLSNATFTINSLLLLSPNGGENFVVNGTQIIRWISHQSIANLKIEYSTNNGTTWNLIEASFPAANKSYSWTVPNRLTSLARIKLTSTSNTDIKDSSDNAFNIGSIAVQSPNGNERWQSGTTKNITWTNISTVAAIKIEYTTNNGAKWYTIASGVNAQNETYSWVVPDSATSMARIRISDMDHPEIKDSSNNVFSIASLKLLSPNGGEVLQTGNAYKIKWKASNVTNVNIEYSADNGLNWYPVTTGYSAAAGSLTWSVYNIPSQTALIRITDAGDAAITDRSDNTFIVKTLNLASPNGGEVIAANSTRNITWTGNGVNRIKLQYSTDSGTSWNLIADNVDALSGSYLWTVPDLEKNTCRIKISDINSPVVTDSSSANFMIAKLDVTKPVAGEVWQNGTTKQITWTASAGIPNVKIEFFNGASWQTIHNAYDASIGNYAWTIPVGISTAQARVKISYTRNGTTISDSSDQFIVNSLQITSPNAGAFWQSGTVKKIEWNSTIVENIKIEYSLDSARTWNTIAGSYPAVNGFYNWNIPSTLDSRNLYFRISDVTKPGIFDISDAAVKAGWIKVISPAADSIWQSEKIRRITWQTSSSVSQLKLEYTTDGTAWNVINADAVSSSSGGYNWSIPADRSSAISMIRIYDAESSRNIIAQSDLFTLVYLKVTSPVSGNNWQAGSTRNVTWNVSNLIPFVNIYYSVNNGQSWSAIATNVDASLQSIAWNIPVNAATTNGLIRIDAASKPYISAINTGKLTISNLSLTSPVGNENWQAGSTKELSWTSTNIDNIRLEYSVDNGGSWNLIAGNIASALGKYSWTIPSSLSSNQAKIRISKSSDAAISSTSSIFTIKRLSVTAPNGGEVWQAGSSKQIRWSEGYVNQVNLYYSVNGGMNWLPITSSYNAALGQYNWTIPNELSTSQARIKITDASNSEIKDSSDNVFSIGSLQITTPAGSEEWQSGTTKQIRWNSVSLGEAELHYTTDNGTSWQLITPSVSTVAGSYTWQIAPALSSEQVRVRLRTKDSTIVSTSNIFKIKRLDLTSPNGAEKWQSGSQKVISWTSGAVSNVNLYYSSNGGSNWQSIATGLNAPAGSYSWTIPQNYSTVQGRIRITDASNSVIRDSSQSNFSIVSLTLTTPIAAAEWQSGTQKNITWNSSNLTDVEIQYTTDNGVNWKSVVSSVTASLRSAAWNIPENISSSQARIRIRALADTSVFSISETFKIKRLHLDSPNGGNVLQAGTANTISWTSGQVSNINISYSTNGGVAWTVIAANVNSALTPYSWNVPEGLNTQNALVKITDASNAAIKDSSDNVFSIGTLKLTSPLGGEQWQAGRTQKIQWQNGSSDQLVIEYSLNGGAQWSVLQGSVPARTGSYNWTIPDSFATAHARIRIKELNAVTLISQSADFTISRLAVTVPSAKEYWQAGKVKDIKWVSGSVNNIKIDLSTDNGASWSVLAASLPAAGGKYSWNIPGNISSLQTLIRISDAANPAISDTINTPIVIGNVAVTAPNNGEMINAGSRYPITWSNSSSVQRIRIELSTNRGNTWSAVINDAPASGSYQWNVPAGIVSDSCLIRVSDAASGNQIYDVSDNAFTITSLALTTPNGGEDFQYGSAQNITWTAGPGIGNIKIEYYTKASGWKLVQNNVPANPGSFAWTVPNDASDSAKVRLSSAVNPTFFDVSDSTFRIANIVVSLPNGAGKYQAGTTSNITWTATSNVKKVNLYYSVNNGASWIPVASEVNAALGSYAWLIPDNPSVSALVRAVDAESDNRIKDNSDAAFTISRLAVTQPAGGEKWLAGSTQVLKWTASADINTVELYYSVNGGTTWNLISDNVPAASELSWSVPMAMQSNNCRILVKDKSTPSIQNQSGIFSVYTSTLTLASFTGGEYIQSGSRYNVKWQVNNSQENVNNVVVELSTDNGTTWSAITEAPVPAAQLSYSWLVPRTTVTSQARIRVKDAVNPFINSASSSAFTIGWVQLVAPDGGEYWQAGARKDITWQRSNNVAGIKIEFSSNNGTSWTTVTPSAPAAAGSYAWTVPNLSSAQALIRISDALSSYGIKDSSSTKFIISSLALSSPNGNETFQAGKTMTVRWVRSSDIANVDLKYSLDSGAVWKSVNDVPIDAASGQYIWTIPDNLCSDKALLKISNTAYPEIQDVSNSSFTVKLLKVKDPFAGNTWQVGTMHAIKWEACGLTNVRIEYSTNNGTSWSIIQANTAAALQTYDWMVPNTISSSALVKITDLSNGTVNAVSSLFTIYKPSVALTSPNGGEIWQAGRKRNITWTSSFADTLKIELSTDNGTSWNTISAAYPAQPGQYQWNIPSDLSTSQALVRITDTKLASVTSASASVFSICQLTVTSPSGGEYWQTGSPRVITWHGSNNISKVRIHYSLDGGTSWNEIVEANNFTASKDTFSWNVPALLSSANAKIKVLNAADTSVYAVSNGLFKLGWLQINSPSAGQVYQAGRNVSLTWNNSSSISVIKIDLYNMKTGQLVKSLQTTAGPAGGSALVPLPDNLETDSAYIRISDLNSSLAIKAVSSVFTVSNLRIITPSSGDNWAAGSMHNIQWYNSSDISLVDVEYSTSPATGWKAIARNVPAAGGSLPWNIPLNISSNQCYIRVSNSSRPGIKDTSDAFNIYIASLTLVSPNGGECLQAGKTYPIKWNSRFVSSIQIEFSYDGGATWPDTVRPVSAADSVWNWNVPSGKSTTAALVRIKDIANLSLSDQSNAAFKIGWVDVTSPAPGANMLAGSLQTITWDHSPSVSYVNIYYTTSPNPSDTSWLPVAAYIRAADKSFKWNPVPSVGSTGAKIRITDAVSNKQISDISDNFTISILRLTYPNGGELWQSGAAYKVKWACSGNLNGLRIQLSTNNGRTWNYSEIADAQSREFSWQVAEGLYTDSALFRISDLSNPSIADSGDRRFQIGALDLASFNDGAKVLAGSVKKIEWAMTGNIKYVDIHYKTSPKGTWKPVAVSVPAQNNQFNWKVPDEPSDSCFIRIRNSYSPWYKDSSDVPFTIARLKLLSPNTPQVWQTGTQKDIVWDSKYIDNLVVEYTTDSIFTEIQTVQAGNGKYSWTIPDNINLASSNYRIRLRDQINPQISDTSSSKFSVAYLKLLQPNGGGGQQIGTEYKVTWLASTNTLSKVNLYVKTSEVSQYIKINTAPITASDPEYLWKITTMPSRSCWIKVEDANNPSVYDESDETFTISEIALIYPNGGKYQKFQVGRTDKIKWSSKFVDSVEILYSPRPDLGYKTIGYAKGTSNEFNWTITPGDYYPTKTGRIMVRDASFNSVRDNSDTTFTISQIKVTAPNSREAWQINTDKVIRWEAENVDSVIVYLNPGNKQPLITIKGPLQSSASGSYVWSIPSNIRVSQAKIKVVDFHNSNVYDESDTTFLIGSTPHVVTAEKYQSRKITLLLNFDSQGDTIDLIDFSYRKPNNIFWTSAAAGLDSSYINIQGPVSQYKIKWNSDAVINDFEGKVDLKLDFKSNYNIMYTVELDSVGIDNKAPQFDPSKIRITQKPVRLGWDKAIISWDNASELNKPVKYSLYPDMNAALPYVETADDTAIVRNMQTATNYMMKLKVSDALGNNASYTFPYKTVAACDFSADNAINAADLAAFVAAWSNPDSVNGADLYPYQGSVPKISVNGDKMLQVEDLLVFVDMWNYFQINRSLPKAVSSELLFAQSSERKLLKLTKGEGGLSFPVEFDSSSGVISFSAEVHYNNSSIKFDSLGIGGSINDGNAVSLVYNDSIRGIAYIDYAELSGKMGSSYSIASKIKSNFDRLSERDSLLIIVKGYNSNLKEVASRNVVYTLQEVPRTFALYQNYPNPFNPATTIEYDLPSKAKVNLTLYDILGRQVAVLVNEEQNEGKHTYKLNASSVNGGLASGVYLYRIHAGDNSVTKKMILLK